MARLFCMANEVYPGMPSPQRPLSPFGLFCLVARAGGEGDGCNAQELRPRGQPEMGAAIHELCALGKEIPFLEPQFLICKMGTVIGAVLQGWEKVMKIM